MRDHPKHTGPRRLLLNALFSSGSFGVNVAIQFLVTPFFVYQLTTEGYGIFALLTGLLGFYGLLDLGLGQGLIKFVSHYHTTNDARALSSSINAALYIQLAIGLTASLAVVYFAPEILILLNVSAAWESAAHTALLLCAVGFFCHVLTGTLASALQGLQRHDVTSKIMIGTEILKNLGIAAALAIGYGLVAAVGITVVATAGALGAHLVAARRAFPTWHLQDRFQWVDLRQLFGFSGYLFINRLPTFLSNQVTPPVIGFLLGPTAVTYYVVPLKIVKAVAGLLLSGFSVIYPYVTELDSLGERTKLKAIWMDGGRLLLAAAAPVYLTIALLSKPIMTVWMGATFAESTWLYLAMLAGVKLLAAFTMVPVNVADGLGYARLRSYFAVSALVAYLALLPLLAEAFGLAGVIYTIAICTLSDVLFVLYFTKRVMASQVTRYAAYVLSFHVPFVALTLLVVLTEVSRYIPDTLWTVVLSVPAVLAYFALMVAIGWLPNLRRRLAQIYAGS